MNHFPFYAGDYLRDTADLSLEHHGAYLLLLCYYYMNEGNLTHNPAGYYRVTRSVTPSEQSVTDWVLDRFFPIGSDGNRHHERADMEIAKINKKIEAARENGKRGGRPKNNPTETYGITQTQSYGEPIPKATQTQKEQEQDQKKKPPSPTSTALPEPPEYVSRETWGGFVAMRRKERHPLTVRAAELIFAKLARFKTEGQDVNEVLDQSTRNGWRDVFAIKPNGSGAQPKPGINRGAEETPLERKMAWLRHQQSLGAITADQFQAQAIAAREKLGVRV